MELNSPSRQPYLGVGSQSSRCLICADDLLCYCAHPHTLHALHTHWVDGVSEAGGLPLQSRSKGPHLWAYDLLLCRRTVLLQKLG